MNGLPVYPTRTVAVLVLEGLLVFAELLLDKAPFFAELLLRKTARIPVATDDPFERYPGLDAMTSLGRPWRQTSSEFCPHIFRTASLRPSPQLVKRAR